MIFAWLCYAFSVRKDILTRQSYHQHCSAMALHMYRAWHWQVLQVSMRGFSNNIVILKVSDGSHVYGIGCLSEECKWMISSQKLIIPSP